MWVSNTKPCVIIIIKFSILSNGMTIQYVRQVSITEAVQLCFCYSFVNSCLFANDPDIILCIIYYSFTTADVLFRVCS